MTFRILVFERNGGRLKHGGYPHGVVDVVFAEAARENGGFVAVHARLAAVGGADSEAEEFEIRLGALGPRNVVHAEPGGFRAVFFLSDKVPEAVEYIVHAHDGRRGFGVHAALLFQPAQQRRRGA